MYYKPSSDIQDEFQKMQNDDDFQQYLSYVYAIFGTNLLNYQKLMFYWYYQEWKIISQSFVDIKDIDIGDCKSFFIDRNGECHDVILSDVQINAVNNNTQTALSILSKTQGEATLPASIITDKELRKLLGIKKPKFHKPLKNKKSWESNWYKNNK